MIFGGHEKRYILSRVERKKVPTYVSVDSLVRVSSTKRALPVYRFNFADPDFRATNIWMENMRTLVQNNVLDDGLIEVEIWKYKDKGWTAIVDDRVPEDYLTDEPFWDGYGQPPEPIKIMMNQRYGWADEQ